MQNVWGSLVPSPRLRNDKTQVARRCPSSTPPPEKWDWDWRKRPVSAFPTDRVEALFNKIDAALSFSGASPSNVAAASTPPPLRAAAIDAKASEKAGREAGCKEGESFSAPHTGDAVPLTPGVRPMDVGEGAAGMGAGAAAQLMVVRPAVQPAADDAARQKPRLQRSVLGPKVR